MSKIPNDRSLTVAAATRFRVALVHGISRRPPGPPPGDRTQFRPSDTRAVGEPLGPGNHVTVRRTVADDDTWSWLRYGLRPAMGLAGLGLVSWRYGFTAAGAVTVAGVVAFLVLPSTRKRMANGVAGRRDGRWVSPPVSIAKDRPVLLVIDHDGLAVLDGDIYRPETRELVACPWAAIEQVLLYGPPGRPERMRVLGAGIDVELAGPFPGTVLDELARFGVAIPDSSES